MLPWRDSVSWQHSSLLIQRTNCWLNTDTVVKSHSSQLNFLPWVSASATVASPVVSHWLDTSGLSVVCVLHTCIFWVSSVFIVQMNFIFARIIILPLPKKNQNLQTWRILREFPVYKFLVNTTAVHFHRWKIAMEGGCLLTASIS